jgi:tellurite resistance protein TehA-like permease
VEKDQKPKAAKVCGPRVPPNLFAIALGIAGLSQAWHAAMPVLGTPPAIPDALNVLDALWLVLAGAYLAEGPRIILAGLRDPVLSPFVSASALTAMLLAAGPARLDDVQPVVHPSRAAFRARPDDGDRTRYTRGCGAAYFAVAGRCVSFMACALGGYAVLMALVQVRLIPVYHRLSFTPGFWSFTFAYTAAAADALVWLAIKKPPGATGYAIAAGSSFPPDRRVDDAYFTVC